jgi:hypothetical protein
VCPGVAFTGSIRIRIGSCKKPRSERVKIFPCCKQCGNKISFELIRRLRDAEELLFGATSFLQKYTESATVSLIIGHFRLLQIVWLLSAVNLKP